MDDGMEFGGKLVIEVDIGVGTFADNRFLPG